MGTFQIKDEDLLPSKYYVCITLKLESSYVVHWSGLRTGWYDGLWNRTSQIRVNLKYPDHGIAPSSLKIEKVSFSNPVALQDTCLTFRLTNSCLFLLKKTVLHVELVYYSGFQDQDVHMLQKLRNDCSVAVNGVKSSDVVCEKSGDSLYVKNLFPADDFEASHEFEICGLVAPQTEIQGWVRYRTFNYRQRHSEYAHAIFKLGVGLPEIEFRLVSQSNKQRGQKTDLLFYFNLGRGQKLVTQDNILIQLSEEARSPNWFSVVAEIFRENNQRVPFVHAHFFYSSFFKSYYYTQNKEDQEGGSGFYLKLLGVINPEHKGTYFVTFRYRRYSEPMFKDKTVFYVVD